MIIKKIENIEAFEGNEGTQIKQIISPPETNNVCLLYTSDAADE